LETILTDSYCQDPVSLFSVRQGSMVQTDSYRFIRIQRLRAFLLPFWTFGALSADYCNKPRISCDSGLSMAPRGTPYNPGEWVDEWHATTNKTLASPCLCTLPYLSCRSERRLHLLPLLRRRCQRPPGPDTYSFKTTISCLPSILLKTNLTWSLKTSGISIPHTYFTKHGSHNSITFIGLLHCALVKLLRLKTMVLSYLPSCHGRKHFIHHSTWAFSILAWNCWSTINFYSDM
jgi:hypothetical protein